MICYAFSGQGLVWYQGLWLLVRCVILAPTLQMDRVPFCVIWSVEKRLWRGHMILPLDSVHVYWKDFRTYYFEHYFLALEVGSFYSWVASGHRVLRLGWSGQVSWVWLWILLFVIYQSLVLDLSQIWLRFHHGLAWFLYQNHGSFGSSRSLVALEVAETFCARVVHLILGRGQNLQTYLACFDPDFPESSCFLAYC